MDLIAQLARELDLKVTDVDAAVKLIDEGNTIPFIARYRKEATGGMDDVALRALNERLGYLRNLEQRKEDVIVLINAQANSRPSWSSRFAKPSSCSVSRTSTNPIARSA